MGMLVGARAVPAAQVVFLTAALIGYTAFSYWFLGGLSAALTIGPLAFGG